MSIGVLHVTLYIPGAHSLKSKRHVVQSLITRLKNKFNIAVAEIDAQDLHQRCDLGIVTINTSTCELQRTMDFVVSFIKGNPESDIVDLSLEIL